MTLSVDHILRRNTILETAFVLFAEEGYGGVTYQKIADRCGIARTTIYKYFQNKEEIFRFAISLATSNLSTMVEKVLDRRDWKPMEKLERILHITVRLLAENRIFLTVVLDYILTQKQSGKDVKRQIRRHTFGMKYLIAKLLRKASELENVDVRFPETSACHLYGILESYVLNLTVTEILDVKDCLELIDSYLNGLKCAAPSL
ncbi:MAG: TetR/AcrR family transcriptional regulator [Thermoguttaceae bacterium]